MNIYNKVLIINTGALGDNLLATPLIKSVHASYPEASVTLVTSKFGHEILKNNPFIKDFLIIDYNDSGFREKIGICKKLKKIKPDLVLNLSEKIWCYLWAFASAAKIRAGFTPGISQPVKSLLIAPLVNYKVKFSNTRSVGACGSHARENFHEAERYCLLLKKTGIKYEAKNLDIYFPEKSSDNKYAEKFKDGIIIHLNQKWVKNGWVSQDFVFMVKYVLQNFKKSRIIISYGELEKNWAGNIIKTIGMAAGDNSQLPRVESYFINDIIEFARYLKNAKLLLSPDTGIVHVADAVGAPVVDIFEEEFFEHNSQRWRPLRTSHVLIKRKPKKEESQKEEFFAEVLNAVEQLLNA